MFLEFLEPKHSITNQLFCKNTSVFSLYILHLITSWALCFETRIYILYIFLSPYFCILLRFDKKQVTFLRLIKALIGYLTLSWRKRGGEGGRKKRSERNVVENFYHFSTKETFLFLLFLFFSRSIWGSTWTKRICQIYVTSKSEESSHFKNE